MLVPFHEEMFWIKIKIAADLVAWKLYLRFSNFTIKFFQLIKFYGFLVTFKFPHSQSSVIAFVTLKTHTFTAWKVFKYGVISSPYFPVFGLNTGKYGPEITPFLDTFHAVILPTDTLRNKPWVKSKCHYKQVLNIALVLIALHKKTFFQILQWQEDYGMYICWIQTFCLLLKNHTLEKMIKSCQKQSRSHQWCCPSSGNFHWLCPMDL